MVVAPFGACPLHHVQRIDAESERHIKPLHWYVACRLVVEGGFDPDEIVPRPPFRVTRKGKRLVLVHGPRRLRAENPVVKDCTSRFNQAAGCASRAGVFYVWS